MKRKTIKMYLSDDLSQILHSSLDTFLLLYNIFWLFFSVIMYKTTKYLSVCSIVGVVFIIFYKVVKALVNRGLLCYDKDRILIHHYIDFNS